jgi:hypothetical protein
MSARRASAYARKNAPPAITLRPPLRLGCSGSRRPIGWADGCSESQRRISASADRSACCAFFELTLRAGRIARPADMLRRLVRQQPVGRGLEPFDRPAQYTRDVDDATLLRRARKGQETAFCQLYDRYQRGGTGRLVRLEVPRESTLLFGVELPASSQPAGDGFVLADVLVGDDGLARAVRFVRPIANVRRQ